ncbi:hypothetical protein IEO21_02230 [Rhodonia placenta]|uniref:Zn(2)-C6 fungal-type domain-containing protein n=1 Tax=Rhodonia placenta TaxID=104341 RepID=A0A8H7U5B9_9APHY|nr:hypothetical protein IEO21_02230 [Postia placenta]
MPAERGTETRRAARKQSSPNDEEIEVKRARGEISCAECRRLKLKCDKKLPCGSCVRRGCTSICPNGSLSAGQGTRFILADTEQLHRKISEMSERIRQLEDVVALFQAGISNERHPLLRDELLTIKFGPEVRRTVDEENTREKLSQSIDALGTLTIGDHGETKYFGRSGGSEVNTPPDGDDSDMLQMSADLENIGLSFPLAIVDDGHDAILDRLEAQLPPRPRAWSLCEAYIAHFTWWFRPIKRDELVDDIMTPIYTTVNTGRPRQWHHPSELDSGRCPHLLAVLYFVLAIGALVDLTLPACSAEAEKYYRLGRAALSLRSMLDSPEIETVQAVSLMAAYHSVCTSRYSVESAWSLISSAVKLAQSVYRDSKQWNLDEKNVQRRRNLFWEIRLFEMIHARSCIALGRPPSISPAHIDCELPIDDEESVSETGETLQGFWHFKMVFATEIYAPVVENMLSAKPPSYATILDLDRRIRQIQLPAVKLYLRPDDDDYNNPSLCMKSYMMSHYRSLTMIHIHRTFFAQALLDNPASPLSSPYAPSFLSANRCASILLKSFIHHHERCGALCGRFWGMWTHAFSAAIIIGATVSRMPQSSLAPSALMELDLAIEVFQRGVNQSLRARQGLPILLRLKERATGAYQCYRDRHNPASIPQPKIPEEYQNALAIFGGQTRVLPAKALSRKRRSRGLSGTPKDSSTSTSSSQAHSPPSPPASVSTPSENGGTPAPDVHPCLMMYLSQVPTSSPFQTADLSQVLHTAPPTNTLPPMPPVMPEPVMPPPGTEMQTPALPQGDLDFLNSLLSNPQYQGLPEIPQNYDAQLPMEMFNNMDMPAFSGDVIMSDQWMSLMQETGILDNVENLTQENGFTPNIFSF